MIELITAGVAVVVVICMADVLAPKLKIAAPLLLVVAGVAASFLPRLSGFELEPELVLEVILPPLLYSSAVAMPAMSFQREFSAISGLAVSLVLISSLGLGLLFAWLVPDLGFVWGVALGAILSPTDAVATSIIKGRGVPDRVVTILDGESLLNDATALVILRTATVAAVAGFSLWGAVGSFAYSVAVAVVIGAFVGFANFTVRKKISNPTVNTVLSFTLPFVASVPAEALGSSGLVAAVVAGLVTGFRGPRVLPPAHRLTSGTTWASISMVLEGVVFLTMGLQSRGVLAELEHESVGTLAGVGIAVLALAVVLVVRGGWLWPQLWLLKRRTDRGQEMTARIEAWQKRLERREDLPQQVRRGGPRRGEPIPPAHQEEKLERYATRLRRASATIGYLVSQPLGPREGAVLVWGGMRGAITVAAAQTLPSDAPHRELLVFVAFATATLSLLVQGGSMGLVVRKLFTAEAQEAQRQRDVEQQTAVLSLLDAATAQSEATLPDDASVKERELTKLADQRAALLDARDDGLFDAGVLQGALTAIDAQQIALEMRGGPQG